jgi:hypothetical protein
MNTTPRRGAGAAAPVTAGPVLAAGAAMAWRVCHGIWQLNRWLPAATSRVEGRAAGADGLV